MKNIIKTIIYFLAFYAFQALGLKKEELNITLQSTLISLDPGGIQDSQSWMVSRQVNCQLVRNEGSKIILDAAESIKYLTPLKIVLKISDKIKFHDGSPIRSEDVVHSLHYIKKSRNILSNFFKWIDKIEIIDEKRILFSLKQQIPQFLKVLAATNFPVFKKDFLDDAIKNKELWKHPLGCGGYRVSEFNNERIKLNPVLKGLPIVFWLNKSGHINLGELDNYDIITLNIDPSISKLKDFNVLEMFDPVQYYIGLNSNSKLWTNKFDRCKFLSKINSEDFVKIYGINAISSKDFLPKGVLGYNPDGSFNNQIISLANKSQNKPILSSQKMCISYLEVSIEEKYRNKFLKIFQNLYKNISMKPILDVKKFGKDFVKKQCDVILFGWKSNYLDGYEYLTMFEKNDANFSGIFTKELDRKILKSQNLVTAESRFEEYKNIVTEIGENCVIKPLYTVPLRNVYIRKTLKTPGIGLISIHQYYLGNISK